jgi:hypothetical protein
MNLNGCRECMYYIVDNSNQIICSYSGKISYRDIYEGRNRRNLILTCPRNKSGITG